MNKVNGVFTAQLTIYHGGFLQKIVNGLTIFAKKHHRRYAKYFSEGLTNLFLRIVKYAILLIIIECSMYKMIFCQYLPGFLVPTATLVSYSY